MVLGEKKVFAFLKFCLFGEMSWNVGDLVEARVAVVPRHSSVTEKKSRDRTTLNLQDGLGMANGSHKEWLAHPVFFTEVETLGSR